MSERSPRSTPGEQAEYVAPDQSEGRAAPPANCGWCEGDGWYVDHSDECYAKGECVGCGGIQRQCEKCSGSGRGVVPFEEAHSAF